MQSPLTGYAEMPYRAQTGSDRFVTGYAEKSVGINSLNIDIRLYKIRA